MLDDHQRTEGHYALPENAPDWMVGLAGHARISPLAASWHASCLASCHTGAIACMDSLAVGDWILFPNACKSALELPIDRYVRVGVHSRQNSGANVVCFCRKINALGQSLGWGWEPTFQRLSQQVLSPLFESLDSTTEGVDIVVFSDLPYGYSMHEVSSAALALTCCLLPEGTSCKDIRATTWRLIPLRMHAGSSLTAASIGSEHGGLLSFNRSKDGGLSFLELLDGDPQAATRNVSDRIIRSVKLDPIRFDVSRFSLIGYKPAISDIGPIHDSSETIRAVKYINTYAKDCRDMVRAACNSAKEGNVNGVGEIMNLNRTFLSHTSVSDIDWSRELGKLQDLPAVSGVKVTCEHRGGAGLILRHEGVEPSELALPDGWFFLVDQVGPAKQISRLDLNKLNIEIPRMVSRRKSSVTTSIAGEGLATKWDDRSIDPDEYRLIKPHSNTLHAPLTIGRLAGAANVGEGIRLVRESHGYSISSLSRSISYSAPYLCQIEHGDVPVSVDVLEELKQSLGFTPVEYRELYRAAGMEYLKRAGWDVDYLTECWDCSKSIEDTFGQMIRRRRLEIGIKARELASDLEINPCYLSTLENDKYQPSLKLLRRIASRLDLNPTVLYDVVLHERRI